MLEIENLKLKDNATSLEAQNLSFRVLDLRGVDAQHLKKAVKRDHFCVFLVESGLLRLQIEDRVLPVQKGKITVIFPDQIHQIVDVDDDALVKVLLFDEVLFCSDILQHELTAYNVDLSTRLNCTLLSADEWQSALQQLDAVAAIYQNPSLIRKEQARFHIKIFLLGLIEAVHGTHPLMSHDGDKRSYVTFKKMLNRLFREERRVSYYADALSMTPKRLNALTKKHCGKTVMESIHERLLKEIKREMLYADKSHKEIALDLGFSSPSALHKFVKAKMDESPSELQSSLEQMYIN